MAKIKTREVKKGSIKTIDRASLMTQHMKSAALKTKSAVNQNKADSENPENYAHSKLSEYGHAAAERAAYGTYKASSKAKSQIKVGREKLKENIEIKKRKDKLLKSRISPKEVHKETNLDVKSSNARTHPARVKTPTEAQRKAAIYRKVRIDKAKREAAAKTSIKLKDSARKAQKNARKAAQRTATLLRRAILGAKALILSLGLVNAIAVAVIIICILFGSAFYFFGDEASSAYTPVSKEVEAYTPVIKKYASEYGISEYTELIKAVMMQESAGKGKDPMQSSECVYNTRYPKTQNGITEPDYSIYCGIRYLKDNLEAAKVSSPVDMDRISLAVQGYNFGSGYIPWALKHYGGYSHAGAVQFSKEQAEKTGMSSYGDIDYVPHVLRYYPYGNYTYDVIDTGPGKFGLPIQGMTKGHISSHFGPRPSPGAGIGSSDHQGLDIAFPTGTKVLACESGTISLAGENGGYGKCIIINHSNNLQTIYAHLNTINVKKGQKVVRGQVIGEVGNTGNSTGPHLHLGIKVNGRFVNPEKGWLKIP